MGEPRTEHGSVVPEPVSAAPDSADPDSTPVERGPLGSGPSGADGNGDAPPGEAAADTAPDGGWRSSYREVMALPEFRAVWLAHALSMAGNYLFNVAVTVLVYQQTRSAFAAGLTLALTFLPQIIGGPLLSGLADLFPRRRVILASEIARAVLVFLIGVPGLPLWGLWVLVFCSILPLIPLSAARAALLAEIVQGDRYVAGSAIINITSQVGTLVGLLVGSAVVGMIGPNFTVMGNGATFLLSAVIIGIGVTYRPRPSGDGAARPAFWKVIRDGARLVFGNPRLRTLGLFAWLAVFYSVPTGIANPLADTLEMGPGAVGLIMAASPAGAILGAVPLTRLINPTARLRLIGPMAVLASVPLLAWVLHPPLWAMLLLLVLSGVGGAYQIVANATFVLCVPAGGRGLAFGLVASGLQAVQGIGIIAGSLLVDVLGSYLTITLAGGLGVVTAIALALVWSRLRAGTVDLMEGAGSA